MHGYTEAEIARFWSKVDVRGADECWVWRASVNARGYGRLGVGLKRDKTCRVELAHRISIAIRLGRPIANGKVVAHHCDNPPCVNPLHLFETTQRGNLVDMRAKGRQSRVRACGDGHGMSKLTEDAVAEIRRRYATEGLSQYQLAAEHSVSQHTISNVITGKTWAHVI